MTERRQFLLGAINEDDGDPFSTNPEAFEDVFESGILGVRASERSFVIRAADSAGRRSDASMLINKMYAWRGYGSGHSVDARPDQMALVATDYRSGDAIGTLTVALDRGGAGLLASRLYDKEVDQLRAQGRRLCEMIKFAVDRSVKSKSVLTALFHVSFIYAYHLGGCTDLLIEVTPQHALFYKHLLHFEQAGEERLNPRVNTRGVLLRLDLDHAAEQIRKFGGQGPESSERSLYPYAFSAKEEEGVVERLRNIERT